MNVACSVDCSELVVANTTQPHCSYYMIVLQGTRRIEVCLQELKYILYMFTIMHTSQMK